MVLIGVLTALMLVTLCISGAMMWWRRKPEGELGALGGTEHHLARLGDWLADNDTLGWKYDAAEDPQRVA